MPTKTQAKTAIDNAAVALKNLIDTILPAGVDIRDGRIDFNPTKHTITLNAGGNSGTAETWRFAIQGNLNNAGQAWTLDVWRRQADGVTEKTFRITTETVTYFIVNF